MIFSKYFFKKKTEKKSTNNYLPDHMYPFRETQLKQNF